MSATVPAPLPPLLSVRDLTVSFPIGKGLFGRTALRAVDGVSLDLARGEITGLVGESGSGKTTFGRALLKAAPIAAGRVTYRDEEIEHEVVGLDGAALADYRRRAQLVFQDPYASLSPRMTVRDIIAEPLEVMGLAATRAEADRRVRAIAARCRLNLEHLRRYPHAFSGGQRQRIAIARALVAAPRFLVADEAVAALDVSIQADVLNLVRELQRETGLTVLFISHNLAVVAHVCDRVAVMYLGKVVETGPTRRLFAAPRHPYTRALLSAIPSLDPDDRQRAGRLQGEIPSPIAPPPGCRFHTRCPLAVARCAAEAPALEPADRPDHAVACHRWRDAAAGGIA
ncbi:ABC transporter ATP-binding protein [Prosthecomicrobium sp. N25]|uniref:ABC transporter ATP-binding protein n=1 Tax=Prosthecomicrobium sp. N25 TaxID=3129254 RepID=UPI0030768B9A